MLSQAPPSPRPPWPSRHTKISHTPLPTAPKLGVPPGGHQSQSFSQPNLSNQANVSERSGDVQDRRDRVRVVGAMRMRMRVGHCAGGSVSRNETIAAASSGASPSLGIAVPGLREGGSRIHFCRSSGPVLGTAPPAIGFFWPTPARFGPIVPEAPGMFGMVWQPPQPRCRMTFTPVCSCGVSPW